jgi:hypothetical protein
MSEESLYSYEQVSIPSKGICYPATWTKDGKISLRPMTTEEEKILTTVRFVKSGKALDMIFKACLENKEIDVSELLSGDRSFLLYFLRAISYGAAYEYRVECPSCSTSFETTYNLNDMITRFLKDGFREPVEYILPMCKKKVHFRLMRGKDEIKLIEDRDRRLSNFGADQIDNTLTNRLSLVIESVDGNDDKVFIEKFINHMIAGDSAALRNFIDQEEPGISTDHTNICPKCAKEFTLDVPVGSSFFSVSKTKN